MQAVVLRNVSRPIKRGSLFCRPRQRKKTLGRHYRYSTLYSIVLKSCLTCLMFRLIPALLYFISFFQRGWSFVEVSRVIPVVLGFLYSSKRLWAGVWKRFSWPHLLLTAAEIFRWAVPSPCCRLEPSNVAERIVWRDVSFVWSGRAWWQRDWHRRGDGGKYSKQKALKQRIWFLYTSILKCHDFLV